MAKSWKRYFIKAQPFCLAVIVFTLAANIALAIMVNGFSRAAGKNFFRPVTCQWIYYLPPHFIFLKNFSVFDGDPSTGKALVSSPSVRVTFSLWRLATERRFRVLSIYCARPLADRHEFIRFVEKNLQQILEFFKSLPLQDIRLSIGGAKLTALKNNVLTETELDFALNLKADSVGAFGTLQKSVAGVSKSAPVQYTFKGSLTPTGIAVEKLNVLGESLRCEFWGETKNAVFLLKGFVFAKTVPAARKDELSSTYRAFAGPRKTAVIGLPGADLVIFDIDAHIKFNYPVIEVERLGFFVNGNPVEIKGSARLTEPVSLNATLRSKFRSLKKPTSASLKDISLSLSANSLDKKLVTNGTLLVDFTDNKAGDLPMENIRLAVNGLGVSFEADECRAHMNTLDLSCKTDANAYRVVLDGLDMIIPEWDAAKKFIKFRSRFYDGSLEGRASIRWGDYAPVIRSVVEVRNASANRLEGILEHFSKIYGKLGSRMRFSTFPKIALEGGLRIRRGYLEDFEFFKWLADVFSLPSLKKVDFRYADAGFSVDENGAQLRNMHLDSDTVKVEGYFKLGKADLVSSKMSLIFGEKLLRESPKFTPLLKVLQNELSVIAFDFQLSGDLERMNFKWLASDFKDKVQKAIPNFVERNIEKNIEEFVEGIRE